MLYQWTHVTPKKLHGKHTSSPQCTNRKGGKAAFTNLQSNVKVLKIRKFWHKDHSCTISSSSKTCSNTRPRLLAMKIARNTSTRSLRRN
ncbi:hypothetical protein ACFX15_033940 [Malus domestica]